MQQLPYYPFITRGGPVRRKLTYDAVVFTEDGHYFAEDSNGHIFCQDSQTSCIQEAISYVAQLGGGRISIKSGTYAINSTININNTRQLIIEGEQNTVLEAASNIVMFQVNTGNFPAYPVTPVVEFRHIIFDGNGYSTNAIYVTNGRGSLTLFHARLETSRTSPWCTHKHTPIEFLTAYLQITMVVFI